MPKRILIADDCRQVREFVRAYLEAHAELQVCGEAADGVEAVERACELRPDLVVVDLAMPRLNGLQVAASLKDALPNTPIVLYTLHKDVLSMAQVRAAGISSVVSKAGGIETLLLEVQNLLEKSKAVAAS